MQAVSRAMGNGTLPPFLGGGGSGVGEGGGGGGRSREGRDVQELTPEEAARARHRK